MSRTFKEFIDTGEALDNRDVPEKDVTVEYYHPEYSTITCPHCGCTLKESAVMPHHYCYECGGKFGNVLLPTNYEEEED